MGKASSAAQWMKRGGLLVVASSIVLMGCQGLLLTYKGQKVRPASRVAVADGASLSETYRAPDLVIDYHASRNGDELQLSGVADYTAQIRNAYVLIPYFHLSVFLTDQYGNILEDRGITTPGSDDPNNRMRFSEKIKLPPGTASMAFSYSGEARSSGSRDEGGGGVSSFWSIPVVK
jgi:hypothetical protein